MCQVFLVMTLVLSKRKQVPNLSHHPNLSILIAAFNEEDYFEKTIKKILSNQYKGDLEIIVINDCFTDFKLARFYTS
ncbi:glycosyltransferase [Bacillaceae bacterium S4-13-56]